MIMAYQLTDLNFKTVSDPAEFMREADEQYLAKVEKAADLILENKKKSLEKGHPVALCGYG